MKRCGYANGYCSSDDSCPVKRSIWPSAEEWETLWEFAITCEHFTWQKGHSLQRPKFRSRRRDWKVGNPYGKA